MTRVGVVAVLLTLTACAPPPAVGPGEGALQTDDAGNVVEADDVRPTGALDDLDVCGAPPTAGPDPAPDGLFLPPGTIVESVEEIDPVVSVTAWAPLTPSQTRRSFEAAAGYEILTREDETYDAELLITDGDERSFVEIVAVCAQGSRFLVVSSAETQR